MPRPVSKRNSWFVTLPIAFGASAYLWLVFFPTARTIRETRSEIREKEAFISQCELLHGTVVHLESDLEKAKQYTNQCGRQTAPVGQISTLLGKITNQVRQSGATATRFEPQRETALETLHRVPVQIELTGSCSDFYRLLSLLEQLPEPLWVDELKLEKPSEAGGNAAGELKLEIFAADFKKSD